MTVTETYIDLMQMVEDRYSCRNYSDKAVSRDRLAAVIQAARMAPSACNRQPWMFVVADRPELCREIVRCYDRPWMKNVPAFIIACGNHDEAWRRAGDGKDHTDIDVAIAIEHLCLAATTLGLGTCWVCNFDVEQLRETLDIPSHIEPIALIPIGYPSAADVAPEKKRKTMEEITVWGKF